MANYIKIRNFLVLVCLSCYTNGLRSRRETGEETIDNSFQHNVDYHLEESGERFKLRSSGKLVDVIDLDNVNGIKVYSNIFILFIKTLQGS